LGLSWIEDYFVSSFSDNDGTSGIQKPLTKKQLEKLPTLEQADYIPMSDVFRTFKEINQLDLVRQAGIRQQYVDQSASLNLAFPKEAEPKFINQVHLEAYRKGVKTLYYMRTESVLRGDIAAAATDPDCVACDG
jgi:ribonucleotide reductase alpha subunit